MSDAASLRTTKTRKKYLALLFMPFVFVGPLDPGAFYSTCMGAFERASITPAVLEVGLISALGMGNSIATWFKQLAARIVITNGSSHRPGLFSGVTARGGD